jgi:hypothetical protein
MTVDWPFDQPPNCAVITLWRILDGASPILYVTHDLEDHGWQFLDGNDVQMKDAAVVCLNNVVELDRSLMELADLPPGWHAKRASAESTWAREQTQLDQK